MAKAATETATWFEEPVFTVLRFAGHTLSSSSITATLYNICTQLFQLTGVAATPPTAYKDLLKAFGKHLDEFPEDKNLVIYVDSIHALNPSDNSSGLDWIPKSLKSNVKLILSVASQYDDIISYLRSNIINSENNFLEIPEMNETDCLEVLMSLLSVHNRTLTQPQQEELMERAFSQCGLPLYVTLLVGNARLWTSRDVVAMFDLPSTCQEYIKAMFHQMTIKHGEIFTQKSLGYLTASKTGLSDSEIEDILSLDDAVLNEVLPGFSTNVRRLPPLVWLRLKNDISDFLQTKECEDVTLQYWSHCQFDEVSRELFLSNNDVQNEIHSALADYFLGCWANKKKPYTRPSSANNNEIKEEADRLVPEQPLTFQVYDKVTVYNTRKYLQVPRHLLLSGRLEELNDQILFSYRWIYNKTKALSLDKVLEDFKLSPGVEASLVEKALCDAKPFIEENIDSMAAEISGRLLPYYSTHSNIRHLIQECDSVGLSHCSFVPNFPYPQVPGSPLKHSITCEDKITDIASHSSCILLKERDGRYVHMYDTETGQQKARIFTSVGTMYTSPDGQTTVIVDHLTEKVAKVHDTDTGAFLGQLIPLNHIKIKPTEKYKLSDVSVSNDHVCMTITTDKSYLFIAELHTCRFMQVVGLEGRSTVCKITLDGRYVFCSSSENLLAYRLDTLQSVTNTALERRPKDIIFNADTSRAFVINGIENKLFMLTLSDGSVDFLYKVVLQESFSDDIITKLSLSHNEEMLLVQGESNVVVYDIAQENISCHFPRPAEVPLEFKLPGANYEEIHFMQTCFSPDDKFIIASIFRNIYIWNVSTNRLLTTLQAPAGIIQDLFISDESGQIISHSKDSDILQIWNIGEAIDHVGMHDKFTAAVENIQLTSNDKRAFIKCVKSDEIGVLDMHSGKVVDLLTHESPVQRLAVSPRGEYVFVAMDKAKENAHNKIWYVPSRKIIYEFGKSAAFFASMTTEDTVLTFCQENKMFKSPYTLTKYTLEGESFSEYQLEHKVNFVLCQPFITPGDKYLVALDAEGYDDSCARHINPSIVATALNGNMTMITHRVSDLQQKIKINRIIEIRPTPNNSYTVVCLFTDEPDPPEVCSPRKAYNHCLGFMIFDICSGVICQVLEDFVSPQSPVNQLLFTNDVSLCLDHESNLFDMGSGYFIKQLTKKESSPRSLALNGKVAVYFKGQELFAIRLADQQCIGHINVHGNITCIKVANDERTLIAGCKDGSIISYVIIDSVYDNFDEILDKISNRQNDHSDSQTKQSRSWDKVNMTHGPPYSRPPTAMIMGPCDRDMLKMIKPVSRQRPSSDTSLYLTSRSTTCVLQ